MATAAIQATLKMRATGCCSAPPMSSTGATSILPEPVQGVSITADGTVEPSRPFAPGRSLVLRAEMALIVVIANCPHVLDARPWSVTPLRATAWRGPVTPEDDDPQCDPRGASRLPQHGRSLPANDHHPIPISPACRRRSSTAKSCPPRALAAPANAGQTLRIRRIPGGQPGRSDFLALQRPLTIRRTLQRQVHHRAPRPTSILREELGAPCCSSNEGAADDDRHRRGRSAYRQHHRRGLFLRESNTLRYGHHTKVAAQPASRTFWTANVRARSRQAVWYGHQFVQFLHERAGRGDGALGIVDSISAPGLLLLTFVRRWMWWLWFQLSADQQPLQWFQSDARYA